LEHCKSICIIGTGRLAFRLSRQLASSALIINQVFGRDIEKANKLARLLGAQGIDDYQETKPDSDLYLILVSDDAIEEVSENLPMVKGLVAHSSGAISSSALKKHARTGVFYPLQSFTEGEEANWPEVPFCVHSDEEEDLKLLENTVRKISSRPYRVNDQQRLKLHTSAVFTNNFVNHILAIGRKCCEEAELPYEILAPLLNETIRRAQLLDPWESQTGPARRDDKISMNKHLEILAEHPHWQSIYREISASITKHYKS